MAKNISPISLSKEALKIIDRFINSFRFIGKNGEISLIASLYAQLSDARADVKECLSLFIVPLENYLSEEDITSLFNEYPAVVRKCYDGLMFNDINSMRNAIRIPNTLINLCIQAVEVIPNSRVFLPFTDAEIAIALDNCHCSGFVVGPYDWALSQILLEACGKQADIHPVSRIPLFDDVVSPTYDYVFTMLPALSVKNDDHLTKSLKNIFVYCLKKGGTMCLITPSSATESSQWREFRQMLVKECGNHSVCVIALPPMLAPASPIDTSVWIIRKEGGNGGKALMVNANEPGFIVVDKETKHRTIKIDSILEAIAKMDNRFSREVPFDKMGDEYRFTPCRYFTDIFLPEVNPDEELLSLGTLIELLEPQIRPNGTTSGKIIGMRELSDNYLTPEIDASSLPEGVINGLVPSSSDGILLGFIGDRFKVGVLQNMRLGETVFLRREIIRFRIKPNAPVKKEYLLRELMSDYVRKQANGLSSGATIRRVNKDDVLSLQILVPPLDRQDQLVFSDGLAGMSAADRERVLSFEEFRKNMHMMKHGLGQTVFNLRNWMQILDAARKAGGGILNENSEIGGLLKVRIGEVFDNIEASISVLSRQISTFDVGYGMKVGQFSLVDFIDKYIETHPRPNVHYDFDSQQYRSQNDVPYVEIDDSDPDNITATEYPGLLSIAKGVALDSVEFPEDALSIIIDNIVSNAVAHGFTDPDREYTIHFDLKASGSSYILSVSNNGNPLPAGKDPEDVFIWGQTSGGAEHAGIGGYQIRDLMEEFGGKADIESTPDEEFTVTYRLTFTKTNLLDL